MKKTKVLKLFLKLIWEQRPSYIFLLLFGASVGTATSILNIYIPKLLIDGFMNGRDVRWFTALLLSIAAAKLLLSILSNYIKNKQDVSGQVLKLKVELAFSEKVMSVDYKFLEDPKYLDLKERAVFAVNNFGALDSLFYHSVNFASSLLTLATVVGLMISFSPVYMLLSLSIAVLTVFVQRRYLVQEQKVLQELIPINRQYNYFYSIALTPEQQKDIRLYRLDRLLVSKIAEKNIGISKWLGTLQTKSANSNSIQTSIISLINLIAYLFASMRVLTDYFGTRIGVGDFTVYINTSEELIRSFIGSFSSIMNINQYLGHLTPFAEFIDIPGSEEKTSGGLGLDGIRTIEFKNVTFKYPSTDRYVLKNVSFRIEKGERISIVGLNNAGKTTIVKLICRLFEPDEGEILVNGININRYRLREYLDQIATVFQDFKLFPFTIEQNINTSTEKTDEEKLQKILGDIDMAGRIGLLPNGVKSLFDKSIYDDAVDMSGGEKQKIAIARALYKNSSLIILDEPTAALDPLAEAEIYENFNKLVKDQTAIYISHRMSSSIFCDKILLIQDGQIAAFDTHENLMKSKNLYSELFNTQAEHYRDKPVPDPMVL